MRQSNPGVLTERTKERQEWNGEGSSGKTGMHGVKKIFKKVVASGNAWRTKKENGVSPWRNSRKSAGGAGSEL